MAKKKEGVEGSGFNYGDAVEVQEGKPTADDPLGIKNQVPGHIVGVHAGGKRVDVRFDKPGHSLHGYTKTYSTDDVARRQAAGEEESEESATS